MPTPPPETEGPAALNPPAGHDEATATTVTAAPEDPWPNSPHPLLTVLLAPRRRFPRWLVAVGGLTASLAVLAFVVVLAWPAGPAPPEPAPAPAFGPRQPVGQVTFDEPTGAAFTQLAGDRAYVAWQRGDNLALVAVELASGGDLWRTSIAGEPDHRWAGLLAGPDVLVAFGHPAEAENAAEDAAEDGTAPAPLPMVVLSAEDGGRRWDRLVHAEDEMWLGVDTLVLVDRVGGVVRGLRPDTGDQRWAVAIPGGPGAEAVAVVPVPSAGQPAGPSALAGWSLPGPYQRLVLVGQDYSARVIDTSHGNASWASNVAAPSDVLLAHGNRLYVAYNYRGYRVDEHDLDNLAGQPRSIYVSPDLQRRPIAMSPCGPDRLCLLDRPDGGAIGQVRAIDVAAGRTSDPQWWVRNVPSAQWLLAAGELLLVGGWQSPMVGYDRTGGPVLEQPDGAAVRLDDDRLLVFSTGPGDWQQDLSVIGLTAGGERTELGQLPGVYGVGCSWNATYLACPDGGGATIWRLSPATQ